MVRVFNCGIGMVVIASADDTDRLQDVLTDHGETVYRIGDVRARRGDEAQTVVV